MLLLCSCYSATREHNHIPSVTEYRLDEMKCIVVCIWPHWQLFSAIVQEQLHMTLALYAACKHFSTDAIHCCTLNAVCQSAESDSEMRFEQTQHFTYCWAVILNTNILQELWWVIHRTEWHGSGYRRWKATGIRLNDCTQLIITKTEQINE